MIREESFSIGKFPWKLEDLIVELDHFAKLYQTRPIKNNQGGQMAAQLFYSWFVAKKIQPRFIIESGVWYGQGTWAFEQACPNAQLICIDPYPRYQQGYQSKKAYYVHKDFSSFDWSSLDKSQTLCFFDDHQDALVRLKFCVDQKFKHIMFEDNYPPGQGDCFSLKKLFEEDVNLEERKEVVESIKVYHEMPPIVQPEKNRWNLEWGIYRSKEPLLTNNIQEDLAATYGEGMQQYTWINYLELVG